MDEKEIARVIHAELRKLDNDYADVEALLGLKPLEVTLVKRTGSTPTSTAEQKITAPV